MDIVGVNAFSGKHHSCFRTEGGRGVVCLSPFWHPEPFWFPLSGTVLRYYCTEETQRRGSQNRGRGRRVRGLHFLAFRGQA